LAKRAALECGLKVIGYQAEWNKYGKSAGPRREKQMLQETPDMVIAFHSSIDASRGTKDMVTGLTERE